MRKKAFRSLEAYNQIWIITERDGTINCADCLGCNAGLTESCFLIASVLFYLEAWTKVDRKLSCMQLKCPLVLLSSANKVEYSRVRDINFKSAKKMKADLDETIENLNEGLQVSENSEVFSGSCVQKPEVRAPTQVELESLTSANAKQSLCCWAWCPLLIRPRRKCRYPLLLVHQLFVFWTRFLPVAAFYVLLRYVSAHDLWLSRLAWRQLQDRLEAFRKKHVTDDLDFGSEANLDRNDPTV